MSSLRDPFTNVHKKDIKNKQGQVVAQVDYVGWSQSADRLDDAAPEGWSFAIMGIGPDWVHGRLTIGERWFENIGYAENADAEWKKEALKDAASDAFKRCAALAGVARYLYDKDNTNGTGRGAPSSTPRLAAVPPPQRTSTDIDPYADLPPDWEQGRSRPANGDSVAPAGAGWTFKQLAEAAEAKGIAKNVIYQTADTLFGKETKVTALTGAQREQIAFEMGL